MSYLLRVTIGDDTAERVKACAERERRKESNMVEVLLLEALERRGDVAAKTS